MSPRLFKYRSVNGYQGTDNHIWPIWKKRVDKKFKKYSYKAYLIVTWHRKLAWTQITVASQSSIKQSEKTANISRHHQWLPRNEGWENDRRNSILMMYHYPHMGSPSDSIMTQVRFLSVVEANFPRGKTSQNHYPGLCSERSPVWNLCARS